MINAADLTFGPVSQDTPEWMFIAGELYHLENNEWVLVDKQDWPQPICDEDDE